MIDDNKLEWLNSIGADPLTMRIADYYSQRQLKWPTISEAIHWHETEMGEALEILLAKSGGWVRNNPDGKPEWNVEKFCEELGDAIFMLIVAGIMAGNDPITIMKMKMMRKLDEYYAAHPYRID